MMVLIIVVIIIIILIIIACIQHSTSMDVEKFIDQQKERQEGQRNRYYIFYFVLHIT